MTCEKGHRFENGCQKLNSFNVSRRHLIFFFKVKIIEDIINA